MEITTISGEMMILFAEDDLGNFTLTKRQIRRWGVDVPIKHFPDGQAINDFLFDPDSIDMHKRRSYLLLLDLNMPKIDGIEILKKIRIHPVHAKMPVFVVTTSDHPRHIEQCDQYGCSEYFVKPLVRERFLKACDNHGVEFAPAENLQ